MAEAERTYEKQFNERELFVLELEKPEDFPAHLALTGPRFSCLLAWDAREVDAAVIAQLARKLLDAGAVYICTWGPGRERIHDIVNQRSNGQQINDQQAAGPNPPPAASRVVVTTGHEEDPLAEAIWHALYCSMPDEPLAEGCGSTLGITIGSPAWAADVRAAFSDPIGFNSRLLHQQH